jgi:hypothetical protein
LGCVKYAIPLQFSAFLIARESACFNIQFCCLGRTS